MAAMELVKLVRDRLFEVENQLGDRRVCVYGTEDDILQAQMVVGIAVPILYVKALHPWIIAAINNLQKSCTPDAQNIETDYIIFGNSLQAYVDAEVKITPYPTRAQAIDGFVFAAIWQRIRAEFEARSKVGAASPSDVILLVYEKLRKKGPHLELIESTKEAVIQHRKSANWPEEGFPDDPVQFDIPKQAEALCVGRLIAIRVKALGLEEVCKSVLVDLEKLLTPPNDCLY